MKKLFWSLSAFACLALSSICNAQVGIITTIAGGHGGGTALYGGLATASPLGSNPIGLAIDKNDNLYMVSAYTNAVVLKIDKAGIITQFAGGHPEGYSGDGGPATDAQLSEPSGIAIDDSGNVYVSEITGRRIRKINTAGIISTFAGDGTSGYTGDGGPATAAKLYNPFDIAADHAGNIYMVDKIKNAVRKINSSGIITTIAGHNTTGSFGGDGGPATAAQLNAPTGVACDPAGNVYIADAGNNRIRKIDLAGIITTVAGNGASGYSGDGGPATAAMVNSIYYLGVDNDGNVFFGDRGNNRLRKISTSGIITTAAGNGINGFTGDGGLSTQARITAAYGTVVNSDGDMYFVDGSRIRKVDYSADATGDSFSVFLDKFCSGVSLTTAFTSYYATSICTYFGDGTADTSMVTSLYPAAAVSHVTHSYASPGNFTIKQVLLNGAAPIDSTRLSFNNLLCRTLALNFYLDDNNNCAKEDSESFNFSPLTIEIDSNGVAICTLSATSGLYYNAYGNPGDIYSFKIIAAPADFTYPCVPSGIIFDTLQEVTYNTNTKYIGFVCSGAAGFDLAENVSSWAGRHAAQGEILVTNNNCPGHDGVVTLNFDPKYIFQYSTPSPTTISGHSVTWNLSAISAHDLPQLIRYSLTVPGDWLLPGDTILTTVQITPISGDLDTTNNVCIRKDTVKSSYDPNEMSISPTGYILPGTTLQYTINFENTGNDTAFNIAVMDTLPDNVDVNTLRIDAASATMNIVNYKAGGSNIVKFDFPNIKLLDSSHHGLCDGVVMFHIKTKGSLADGTTLFNHAGIFFDDNAVVMTDTVANIISLIHGPSIACVGTPGILTELATGGIWTSSNASANITTDGSVIGVAAGIDTLTYTINSRYGATSVTTIFTINATPVAIMGTSSLCVGQSAILSDTTTGGIWNSTTPAIANIDGSGNVTAIFAGTTAISYLLAATGCAAVSIITVNPQPAAITGPSHLCVGQTITLSDATAGGSWVSGVPATALVDAAGSISAISAGTTIITYTLPTSCQVTTVISVNPLPITYSVTGGGTLCSGSVGADINLANSDTGIIYQLYNGTSTVGTGLAGTGTTLAMGTYTDAGTYTVSASNPSNSCTSNMAGSAVITTATTVIPTVGITSSAADTICVGNPVTLTATGTNGGTAPSYQWQVNGVSMATGPTYTYTPADNDIVAAVLTSNAVCASPDTAVTTKTMFVRSSPIPVVSLEITPSSYINAGEIVTINATVANPGPSPVYGWYINGGLLPGATTNTLIRTFANNDSVSYFISTGGICDYSSFNSVVFHVIPTSVLQPANGANEIKLVPNPNKGVFTITGSIGSTDEAVTVEITNMIGQVVYKKQIIANNGNIDQQIQLGKDMAGGIYLLNLRTAGSSKVIGFTPGRIIFKTTETKPKYP